MSKKKDIRKKTAKAIVTAATVSTVVATPAVFADDEIINPEPVTEEIILEQEENAVEDTSKIPYWIKSLIVTPFHFLASLLAMLATSAIKNPLVRNILMSLILIALIITFLIIGIRKLYPKLPIDKIIKNRYFILTSLVSVILFLTLDLWASNNWADYSKYGPQIKIAASIIILTCGSYLLYADNKEEYLIISDENLTISQ